MKVVVLLAYLAVILLGYFKRAYYISLEMSKNSAITDTMTSADNSTTLGKYSYLQLHQAF